MGIFDNPLLAQSSPGTGLTSLGQGWGNYPQPDYSLSNSGAIPGFGNMVGDAVSNGGTSTPSFMQNLFGFTDDKGIKTAGWGGMGLDLGKSLFGAYGAMKQYGLAKDQFNFQKEFANKNFAAQRQNTNTRLEDRQRARVASNAGAYESVGKYMQDNGIA